MAKSLKEVNKEVDFSVVFDFWNLLTPDEQEILKNNYDRKVYKKNDGIYTEGDTPKRVYCVISGKVKIHKTGVGGRAQIVRMCKPYEMLGYRAMFVQENFVTAATAFEPTVIYSIPKDIIENLILGNPRLGWYFILALSKDLGIADRRAVSLTQKHIRGRLAESLLFLIENYGFEADGATISIYLSREDLASLSNMTTSNAIRTLSNFVSESIIAMDGRKIKIIDEDGLREISKIG